MFAIFTPMYHAPIVLISTTLVRDCAIIALIWGTAFRILTALLAKFEKSVSGASVMSSERPGDLRLGRHD
jgi:hypothetical protein